jgi:single-stranded DNA-binding protein
MDMQTLLLLGRATKSPETLETKAGKSFKKFTLAVNMFKGKELGSEAFFYDIACFSQRSQDIAERIESGDTVYVCGQPEVFAYVGEDGEAKGKISVGVSDMKVYSPKSAPKTKELIDSVGDSDGD